MSEAIDMPRRIEVRDGVAPGALLAILLLVSLVLHGGLGVWVYNKPLGHVDPASLADDRPPIRVKRAMYDEVTGVGGQSEEARAAQQQMSLADLSQTLLQETDAPGLDSEFEPELQLRDLDETLPASAAAELAVELPAFELPDDVLQTLTSEQPGELAYRSSEEAGFGIADTGDGTGRGAGGGGGSAEAARLLRSTGLVTGVRGAPSPLERTLIDDTAAFERGSVDLPLAGPEIDFAGLALAETTQIDVPEHLDQDFDYTVTRYDASGGAEPGYFRVDIAARRSLVKLRTMPKDVIFVIDTSGSVPQSWVEEVATGVQQGLRTLNEGDRFNIVMFSESPAFFSTRGPLLAAPETIEAGVRFLTNAHSQGYTDVNAALSQLLVRDVAVDRVYELVLISDGLPTKGVMDTRELINLITRDNNLAASIYCVGVGRQQNRELLDFLAYRNKGFCLFAGRQEQVAPAIRDLMSRLRYPLIKNLRVSVAGQSVDELYPIDLPNIHQGERFSLFGRYARPGTFTIQIDGVSAAPGAGGNGGRSVDFSFTRDLAQAPAGTEAIARDWAFWKLHHLYSEIIRQGSSQRLLDQIDELRRKYKLKTLY